MAGGKRQEQTLDGQASVITSARASSLSDWIQRLGPAARFCWFGGVASACRLPDGLAGAAFGACHVRIDLNLPFTPRT